MQLYGPLYRLFLFPAWESGIRRRSTLRHLRFLQKSQWRSPDELAEFQAGELRRLIGHAYANVPFYRERLDAAAVAPEDIRTAADLRALPLLTRNEARESTGRRQSLAPPLVAITKRTSGSTGQPLEFGYDEGSEWWRQATRLRGYGWAGYRQGDRVLHYWSMPPPRNNPSLYWRTLDRLQVWSYRRSRNEYWVDSSFQSEERLAETVALIRRRRPAAIVCYAQAGADLASYVVSTGGPRWSTIPVLCGAEKLDPSGRELLEQAFGSAVFETYGNREVMLMASECAAHDGLHVQAENLVVEIVVRDEETEAERPARPGEMGEIAVTDLHNFGMPFIRYLNGDLAIQGDDSPCRCGRGLPRIAAVVGRSSDTLVDGAGRKVRGTAVMTLFVDLASAVRRYQAVQHPDRSLTLRVVPTETFDAAARERIRTHLAYYLPGIDARVELVDEIPLDATGKRRFIVRER